MAKRRTRNQVVAWEVPGIWVSRPARNTGTAFAFDQSIEFEDWELPEGEK
jgi:hypothetical protein